MLRRWLVEDKGAVNAFIFEDNRVRFLVRDLRLAYACDTPDMLLRLRRANYYSAMNPNPIVPGVRGMAGESARRSGRSFRRFREHKAFGPRRRYSDDSAPRLRTSGGRHGQRHPHHADRRSVAETGHLKDSSQHGRRGEILGRGGSGNSRSLRPI